MISQRIVQRSLRGVVPLMLVQFFGLGRERLLLRLDGLLDLRAVRTASSSKKRSIIPGGDAFEGSGTVSTRRDAAIDLGLERLLRGARFLERGFFGVLLGLLGRGLLGGLALLLGLAHGSRSCLHLLRFWRQQALLVAVRRSGSERCSGGEAMQGGPLTSTLGLQVPNHCVLAQAELLASKSSALPTLSLVISFVFFTASAPVLQQTGAVRPHRSSSDPQPQRRRRREPCTQSQHHKITNPPGWKAGASVP